ncbi:hypothetical protein [Methylobacterium soli]|uniref:Uncharacterized protein n=1 Tax=Methylobacterium soli TaxID=553447 RepID=A0A6L3SUU2_9HYPH|nr:hypothetical protein [Methylobacterium soli]KAB1075893.1 hypothetical protein F6X53_23980 [Methylobacterium soli]GJE46228.1 hypothetical protein AEGHOMDF_5428 [Methylobacterium soli]
MLVNHERRLLKKAAEAVDFQISIKQKPNSSWPGDHSRLSALESRGDLRRIGVDADLETWQITDSGLARAQRLTGQDA